MSDNSLQSTLHNAANTTAMNVDQLAERAAGRAEQAIDSTQRAANGALDALHSKVDHFRDSVPNVQAAIARAAADVDEMAHRALERARTASADVRHQVGRAGERTVHYIQDEPVNSVLIAAATGAAVAALIGLLSRSHTR